MHVEGTGWTWSTIYDNYSSVLWLGQWEDLPELSSWVRESSVEDGPVRLLSLEGPAGTFSPNNTATSRLYSPSSNPLRTFSYSCRISWCSTSRGCEESECVVVVVVVVLVVVVVVAVFGLAGMFLLSTSPSSPRKFSEDSLFVRSSEKWSLFVTLKLFVVLVARLCLLGPFRKKMTSPTVAPSKMPRKINALTREEILQ